MMVLSMPVAMKSVVLATLLVTSTIAAMAQSDSENVDLVITNGRLLDGTGLFKTGTGLIINDGKIVGTLQHGDAEPRADRVIDAGGGTIMPGLVDTHVHLFVSADANDLESALKYRDTVVAKNLRDLLQMGVTTVRSMGDPEDIVFELRDMVNSGKIAGPRMRAVGPGITMVNGHPAVTVYGQNPFAREQSAEEVDTPEKAREAVNRLADKGADMIKVIYEGDDDIAHAKPNPLYERVWGIPTVPRFSTGVLAALIEAGHARGLKVIVHTADEEHAMNAVRLGADGLEHGLSDEPNPASEELMKMLVANDISYSGTLQVYDEIAKEKLEHALPQIKRVSDAGVKVVIGTDTFGVQKFGDRTIREMELLVEAGLDPTKVIQAATINGAEVLGLIDMIGTLDEGKVADVIVVDGNPLENVSILRNVKTVLQEGKIVKQ